ncbi:MerR family transcriptional regulator [Thiospirochaeta perfilievii]|uniref:MerR family transcriptional regulator n=2 Tax=Thiospirochaeta perfilievii TaxID=252967 RepID=A0A5C1QCP4_9SPIO|nr:MerR family transcriptional regulator [Thiospirochaeta perfilievii]
MLTPGVCSRSSLLLENMLYNIYYSFMTHYSMKEIIKETGLTSDTLRYYEKDGLLSDILRLPNGHRRYSNHDLEWLKFILCLRSTGMPLKNIKKYKELMNLGDKTTSQRKEILTNQKLSILNEMEVLKEALERIDWKIEYYESVEANL